MLRFRERLPYHLSAAALALLVAACVSESTAPSSEDASLRADIVPQSATYLIDTGPGGTSSIGSQSFFSKGSTTCSPQPDCFGNFQFLAGKFTLADSADVESLEAWLSVGIAGNAHVHIRSDSVPPAGNNIPGHSLHSVGYTLGTQTFGWKVFSSFTVGLRAGTYWITLEPDSGTGLNGGMSGGAASPLADYAFFADGNNRWVPYSAFSQHPALGFRVFGTAVVTPSQRINTLIAYVDANVPKANARKIDQDLQAALTAIGANQTAAACADVQSVITYVNGNSTKKLSASVKSEITSQANTIRSSLGC